MFPDFSGIPEVRLRLQYLDQMIFFSQNLAALKPFNINVTVLVSAKLCITSMP